MVSSISGGSAPASLRLLTRRSPAALRNQVERLWARLKEWRAVATRYEKTACLFTSVLCLAAAMDWIRR